MRIFPKVRRLYRTITVVFALCSLSLAMGGSASVAQSVKSAYVDAAGKVHVVYGDGRDTLIPWEEDQVSSDAPAVALDHETVGWLVLVPNCCTSYPVPVVLVIYRSGRIVQQIGDGMMVYKWQFLGRVRGFFWNGSWNEHDSSDFV
jgi:hypothetical protein